VDIYEPLSEFFEKYLYLSEVKITPREYTKMFITRNLIGLIASLGIFIFVHLLNIGLIPNINIETIFKAEYSSNIITLLYLISITPIVVTLLITLSPVLEAMEHVSQAEREMPYFTALLTIFASAGLPPHVALERIEEKVSLFPAISRIAKRIKKLKLLFIMDDIGAIETEGRRFPSPLVSDVLLSLAAAERGGGDIYAIFRDKMKSAFTYLKEKYKSLADQMKMIGDVILVFYGILPLTLYVMFALFASENVVIQSYMYSLIANPLMAGVLVLIIDQIYPKTLVKYTEYYKRLLFYIPLGAVVFAALYFPTMYLEELLSTMKYYRKAIALGAAIIAVLISEAIRYVIESRRLMSITLALPSFTRDLTEEIKEGQTPSLAIGRLIKLRTYGKHLDKILRRINLAINSGHTFKEAVELIMNELPWHAKLTFTLLIEADIIGAKPEIFEEITNVTREVVDSINIARKGTVPIRLFGLATAGLIVATTTLLVRWVLIPIAKMAPSLQAGGGLGINIGFKLITENELPGMIDSVLIGCVITSFFLGLLTGKMSEGNLASGFIYAVFTVLLSIVITIIMFAGVVI